MGAGRLRADVDLLLLFYDFAVVPLLELPWQVMASEMQLKVLVSLEALSADLTEEPVGRH